MGAKSKVLALFSFSILLHVLALLNWPLEMFFFCLTKNEGLHTKKNMLGFLKEILVMSCIANGFFNRWVKAFFRRYLGQFGQGISSCSQLNGCCTPCVFESCPMNFLYHHFTCYMPAQQKPPRTTHQSKPPPPQTASL